MTGLSPAYAAEAPVGLGTAGSYAVLGGQSVTNTGASVLNGDLGVSPGTAITGFPPGLATGTLHVADAHAAQAQSDLTIAYNDAAGRSSGASVNVLVSETLLPGVYTASSDLAVDGALTLDGQGNANSVFIFQAGSTLTTASASSIVLTNGAQACNVFWQVGSSATLGTGTTFKGTIMALMSISVTTGSTVEGRAFARNGSVTLDNNVFTAPGCAATPTGSATATVSPTETATVMPTETTSAAPTQTTSAIPILTPAVTSSPGTTPAPSASTPETAGPLASSATVSESGAPLADTGQGAGTNRGVNIDTATNAAPGTPPWPVILGAVLIALSASIYLGWSLLISPRRRAD